MTERTEILTRLLAHDESPLDALHGTPTPHSP
jgi:hypothetical protein